MNLSDDPKKKLRALLKSLRDQLSPERKKEGSILVVSELESLCAPYSQVASFSSFASEIDLWEFNRSLSKDHRLLLPRVETDSLIFYAVKNLETDLVLSPFGIWEPDPKRCSVVPLEEIDCILVPGLGFDERKMRLGYGKGHYDRVLKSSEALSVGVGFQEQMTPYDLPCEPHDQPVDNLLLG